MALNYQHIFYNNLMINTIFSQYKIFDLFVYTIFVVYLNNTII